MQKQRLYLKVFAVVAALCTAAAFAPVNDHLPHPKAATVQFDDGLQIPVKLSLSWYDRGLHTNRFEKSLEFDANGQVLVTDTAIPTRLWQLVEKRILTLLDKWTACENCYGPCVICSLELKDGYSPPEKMRLVQNKLEQGDIIVFKVSLIPDEATFESREFQPDEIGVLLNEARELIAEGDSKNISANKWGTELSKINPVRIECRDSVLVIWMGGKVGYVINPDSSSCPAFNMAFVSGTEHPHIFKLEKM